MKNPIPYNEIIRLIKVLAGLGFGKKFPLYEDVNCFIFLNTIY